MREPSRSLGEKISRQREQVQITDTETCGEIPGRVRRPVQWNGVGQV